MAGLVVLQAEARHISLVRVYSQRTCFWHIVQSATNHSLRDTLRLEVDAQLVQLPATALLRIGAGLKTVSSGSLAKGIRPPPTLAAPVHSPDTRSSPRMRSGPSLTIQRGVKCCGNVSWLGFRNAAALAPCVQEAVVVCTFRIGD